MANSIDFTRDDIEKATDFANAAEKATYNRRGKSQFRHNRNLRIGKLGEIAFAKFLSENKKMLLGHEDMFMVWENPLILYLIEYFS